MPGWLLAVLWVVFSAAAIYEYAILPAREEREAAEREAAERRAQ